MAPTYSILVVSDIHYAGPAERQRGSCELKLVGNPLLRLLLRTHRRFVWRRDPFGCNHLLDEFVTEAEPSDYAVANGDYSTDSAFLGIMDDPCRESVHECLSKLRTRFGSSLRLVLGDHELGKMSLVGGGGGIRLESFERAQKVLGIEPFWTLQLGKYLLVGVTSSLIAFPVFEPEALVSERARWYQLREEHLARIRQVFQQLQPGERLLLFCHDPTALPFLWRDPAIRERISAIEATVIGHLHSELFMWKSRLLSGMPTIGFLGNSVRRFSAALNEAKLWKHFHVRLCPSLGGIELLKDGGYFRLLLDATGRAPVQFQLCHLPSQLRRRVVTKKG
jgi:hypothetical protein